MDTMLIAVTGISVAIAAGMGVLLARMVRDERLRSDARVQLLTEIAGEDAPGGAPARTPGTVRTVSSRQGAVPLGELTIRPEVVRGGSTPHLFAEHAVPSAWPRRFAVVGAMAAVLILTVVGYRQMTSPEGASAPQVAATAPSTAPAASAPTASAPTAAAPLELVTLRHTLEGGLLTVTGLVQNPQSGATLSGVRVTLFVFGAGGTFITSGRAPVDFTSLTPGDESPFVIRVPVSRAVERYRVGFRDAEDRTLAHLDRRSADTIAQK